MRPQEFTTAIAVLMAIGSATLASTPLAPDQVAGLFGSGLDSEWKWSESTDEETWDWDDRYDHWYDEWSLYDAEKIFENIRYNRVEGLFLGAGEGGEPIGRSRFLLFGDIGYGFKSKAWRYHSGLSRWWGERYRTEVGAITYDLTDTDDRWLLPTMENSLAALVFREDFHDFFRRKGTSVFVHQDIARWIHLSAEYRSDRYENMKQKAHWSLLGGDKTFRDNLPILPEGCPADEMRSVVAGVTFDTRDDHYDPREGWHIRGEYEYAGRSLEGDFEFDRLLADVRRYQPLAGREYVDARIRVGSVKQKSEHMPAGKLFDLGGIGSLRGYRFKEYRDAAKLVLGNVEYRIGGDKLSSSDHWLFKYMTISFFGDAGWVGDSFTDMTFGAFRTDMGIGLSGDDQAWRLDFAKSLDQSEGIVITFRINRMF